VSRHVLTWYFSSAYSSRLNLDLDVDGAAPKLKRIRRLEIRVIRARTYLHPLPFAVHFTIVIAITQLTSCQLEITKG
jgi:hypothetical protein